MGLGRRRPVAKLLLGPESDSVRSLLQKTTYPLAYKDVSPIYGCVIACLTALLAIRFQRGIRMINSRMKSVWSSSLDESHWDQRNSLDVLTFFVPWFMTVNAALDRKASELAQRSLSDAILMMVFSGRDADTSKHIIR